MLTQPSKISDLLQRGRRAFTLVEAMIAMAILTVSMLGFLSTFLQSRRTTETNVMHAAATNIVYGIIEQIKQLDYTTMLPNGSVDPADPSSTAPYTVRVKLNQNTLKWLRVTYTASPTTPKAPLTNPNPYATAASVGTGGAIDNVIGPFALSSAAGTASQSISINLWIWIDEIPDLSKDVTDVKRITVVYTYDIKLGSTTRTVRNREVFLRTRYDR